MINTTPKGDLPVSREERRENALIIRASNQKPKNSTRAALSNTAVVGGWTRITRDGSAFFRPPPKQPDSHGRMSHTPLEQTDNAWVQKPPPAPQLLAVATTPPTSDSATNGVTSARRELHRSLVLKNSPRRSGVDHVVAEAQSRTIWGDGSSSRLSDSSGGVGHPATEPGLLAVRPQRDVAFSGLPKETSTHPPSRLPRGGRQVVALTESIRCPIDTTASLVVLSGTATNPSDRSAHIVMTPPTDWERSGSLRATAARSVTQKPLATEASGLSSEGSLRLPPVDAVHRPSLLMSSLYGEEYTKVQVKDAAGNAQSPSQHGRTSAAVVPLSTGSLSEKAAIGGECASPAEASGKRESPQRSPSKVVVLSSGSLAFAPSAHGDGFTDKQSKNSWGGGAHSAIGRQPTLYEVATPCYPSTNPSSNARYRRYEHPRLLKLLRYRQRQQVKARRRAERDRAAIEARDAMFVHQQLAGGSFLDAFGGQQGEESISGMFNAQDLPPGYHQPLLSGTGTTAPPPRRRNTLTTRYTPSDALTRSAADRTSNPNQVGEDDVSISDSSWASLYTTDSSTDEDEGADDRHIAPFEVVPLTDEAEAAARSRHPFNKVVAKYKPKKRSGNVASSLQHNRTIGALIEELSSRAEALLDAGRTMMDPAELAGLHSATSRIRAASMKSTSLTQNANRGVKRQHRAEVLDALQTDFNVQNVLLQLEQKLPLSLEDEQLAYERAYYFASKHERFRLPETTSKLLSGVPTPASIEAKRLLHEGTDGTTYTNDLSHDLATARSQQIKSRVSLKKIIHDPPVTELTLARVDALAALKLDDEAEAATSRRMAAMKAVVQRNRDRRNETARKLRAIEAKREEAEFNKGNSLMIVTHSKRQLRQIEIHTSLRRKTHRADVEQATSEWLKSRNRVSNDDDDEAHWETTSVSSNSRLSLSSDTRPLPPKPPMWRKDTSEGHLKNGAASSTAAGNDASALRLPVITHVANKRLTKASPIRGNNRYYTRYVSLSGGPAGGDAPVELGVPSLLRGVQRVESELRRNRRTSDSSAVGTLPALAGLNSGGSLVGSSNRLRRDRDKGSTSSISKKSETTNQLQREVDRVLVALRHRYQDTVARTPTTQAPSMVKGGDSPASLRAAEELRREAWLLDALTMRCLDAFISHVPYDVAHPPPLSTYKSLMQWVQRTVPTLSSNSINNAGHLVGSSSSGVFSRKGSLRSIASPTNAPTSPGGAWPVTQSLTRKVSAMGSSFLRRSDSVSSQSQLLTPDDLLLSRNQSMHANSSATLLRGSSSRRMASGLGGLGYLSLSAGSVAQQASTLQILSLLTTAMREGWVDAEGSPLIPKVAVDSGLITRAAAHQASQRTQYTSLQRPMKPSGAPGAISGTATPTLSSAEERAKLAELDRVTTLILHSTRSRPVPQPPTYRPAPLPPLPPQPLSGSQLDTTTTTTAERSALAMSATTPMTTHPPAAPNSTEPPEYGKFYLKGQQRQREYDQLKQHYQRNQEAMFNGSANNTSGTPTISNTPQSPRTAKSVKIEGTPSMSIPQPRTGRALSVHFAHDASAELSIEDLSTSNSNVVVAAPASSSPSPLKPARQGGGSNTFPPLAIRSASLADASVPASSTAAATGTPTFGRDEFAKDDAFGSEASKTILQAMDGASLMERLQLRLRYGSLHPLRAIRLAPSDIPQELCALVGGYVSDGGISDMVAGGRLRQQVQVASRATKDDNTSNNPAGSSSVEDAIMRHWIIRAAGSAASASHDDTSTVSGATDLRVTVTADFFDGGNPHYWVPDVSSASRSDPLELSQTHGCNTANEDDPEMEALLQVFNTTVGSSTGSPLKLCQQQTQQVAMNVPVRVEYEGRITTQQRLPVAGSARSGGIKGLSTCSKLATHSEGGGVVGPIPKKTQALGGAGSYTTTSSPTAIYDPSSPTTMSTIIPTSIVSTRKVDIANSLSAGGNGIVVASGPSQLHGPLTLVCMLEKQRSAAAAAVKVNPHLFAPPPPPAASIPHRSRRGTRREEDGDGEGGSLVQSTTSLSETARSNRSSWVLSNRDREDSSAARVELQTDEAQPKQPAPSSRNDSVTNGVARPSVASLKQGAESVAMAGTPRPPRTQRESTVASVKFVPQPPPLDPAALRRHAKPHRPVSNVESTNAKGKAVSTSGVSGASHYATSMQKQENRVRSLVAGTAAASCCDHFIQTILCERPLAAVAVRCHTVYAVGGVVAPSKAFYDHWCILLNDLGGSVTETTPGNPQGPTTPKDPSPPTPDAPTVRTTAGRGRILIQEAVDDTLVGVATSAILKSSSSDNMGRGRSGSLPGPRRNSSFIYGKAPGQESNSVSSGLRGYGLGPPKPVGGGSVGTMMSYASADPHADLQQVATFERIRSLEASKHASSGAKVHLLDRDMDARRDYVAFLRESQRRAEEHFKMTSNDSRLAPPLLTSEDYRLYTSPVVNKAPKLMSFNSAFEAFTEGKVEMTGVRSVKSSPERATTELVDPMFNDPLEKTLRAGGAAGAPSSDQQRRDKVVAETIEAILSQEAQSLTMAGLLHKMHTNRQRDLLERRLEGAHK